MAVINGVTSETPMFMAANQWAALGLFHPNGVMGRLHLEDHPI